MKYILTILTLLFLVSCKEKKPVYDYSRQKTYEGKNGFLWVADSNCVIKMYVHDTVYIHDTIYIGDAGIKDGNTGMGFKVPSAKTGSGNKGEAGIK